MLHQFRALSGDCLPFALGVVQSDVYVSTLGLRALMIVKSCFHQVYLEADKESDFLKNWGPVLEALQCVIVRKMLPNAMKALSDGDEECDVIITQNRNVPKSLENKSGTLKIPMVSLEWLIQCVIYGRKLDFDAHPKFAYDYE